MLSVCVYMSVSLSCYHVKPKFHAKHGMSCKSLREATSGIWAVLCPLCCHAWQYATAINKNNNLCLIHCA